ncbi:retropepsin-like aspartic protease family protein [Neogemmobacter tilapiae]|uniref:Aspartyl protease n=1 Tax=Neogemmobacter tilapiae TaxID=875041 RepID=A0A918WH09_9RHOB|nr:TIGR02281 family clan AA aspartic protease [Gemmobacter tilapiae]GHC43428.1 aspartyl protease [Gemmobacter tilapiae]
METEDLMRLTYLGILSAALIGWALVEYRGRLGAGMRMMMAWGAIFVAVAAGYGLWNDIRGRETGRLMVDDQGRIELPMAQDGHYYATLEIGGTMVDFMIDTGASDVVLNRAAAERLGFDLATLDYSGQAFTANGAVRTARVFLDDVSLGPYDDQRITAYVNDGELDIPLLGMDYLRRYRIEMAGNRMILSR